MTDILDEAARAADRAIATQARELMDRANRVMARGKGYERRAQRCREEVRCLLNEIYQLAVLVGVEDLPPNLWEGR